VTPCSLVACYQSFRRTYCLLIQGRDAHMFLPKTASQHKDNNLHNAATAVRISGL